MKCISVCQPFADLIIDGKKIIELRTWNTNYRGKLLIHAPQKIRTQDCKRLKIKKRMQTGFIIGYVELYTTKKYQTKIKLKEDYKKHLANMTSNKNKYGFLFQNPHRLRIPIPYKGALGIFDVSVDEKNTLADMKREIIEEEYRYQWINHH